MLVIVIAPVQCDWVSVAVTVALCVENVLVGGRNFNKFKSGPVTDKCCQAGTGGGRAVTPSRDIICYTFVPTSTTTSTTIELSKSEQCEA